MNEEITDPYIKYGAFLDVLSMLLFEENRQLAILGSNMGDCGLGLNMERIELMGLCAGHGKVLTEEANRPKLSVYDFNLLRYTANRLLDDVEMFKDMVDDFCS